jgi:hypothetical protein
MSFEEYLRKARDLGFTNFHVKSYNAEEEGKIAFFIHPVETNGARHEFIVTGNLLTPKSDQ